MYSITPCPCFFQIYWYLNLVHVLCYKTEKKNASLVELGDARIRTVYVVSCICESRSIHVCNAIAWPVSTGYWCINLVQVLCSQTVYNTKGTRAHTHRELIRDAHKATRCVHILINVCV